MYYYFIILNIIPLFPTFLVYQVWEVPKAAQCETAYNFSYSWMNEIYFSQKVSAVKRWSVNLPSALTAI